MTTDVLQYEVMFDKAHGHFIQSSTLCYNLPAGSKDSLVLWPVDELPRWGKFIPHAPPVRGCAEVCSSVLFVMP